MTTDRSDRQGRRRVVRSGRRLAVLGAAAAFTVLLAQHTTTAAFTAQTGDTGNTATTAASFCTVPGPQTVSATADTTVYQTNPTNEYGFSGEIGVGSGSGANGRVLLRFPTPSPPGSHCALTAAKLRLHVNTPSATSRTINVYRVDPLAPVWSEAATNWSNQPTASTTGPPVPSTSLGAAGWQEWPVLSMVTAHYAGPNSGFLLCDNSEGSASPQWQLYGSRDYGATTLRPELVLTWG
jgi:hypothetical protein